MTAMVGVTTGAVWFRVVAGTAIMFNLPFGGLRALGLDRLARAPRARYVEAANCRARARVRRQVRPSSIGKPSSSVRASTRTDVADPDRTFPRHLAGTIESWRRCATQVPAVRGISSRLRDHRALHDRGSLRGRGCHRRRISRAEGRARRSPAAGRLSRANGRGARLFAFDDVVRAMCER